MATPSIDYMREYFKQAANLERHIYVLKNAKNKAQTEINALSTSMNNLAADLNARDARLKGLDEKYVNEANRLENTMKEDKKNLPRFKRRSVLLLLLIIPLAVCLLPLFVIAEMDSAPIIFPVLAVLLIFISMPLVALFIICKVRASRARSRIEVNEKRNLVQEKETEKNQLTVAIRDGSRQLEQSLLNQKALKQAQATLSQSLEYAILTLQRLYGKNLVAAKYHNFTAMATFYEYLETERCVAISGPNGVIDTYVKDIQMGRVIQHLSNIEAIVSEINDKTNYLCDQATLANQHLSHINSNLASIKVNTAVTAANTAQIANYCGEINSSIHRVERAFF